MSRPSVIDLSHSTGIAGNLLIVDSDDSARVAGWWQECQRSMTEYRMGKEVLLEEQRTNAGHYEVSIAKE